VSREDIPCMGGGILEGEGTRKCEMTVTDEGRDVRQEVCMRGRNFFEGRMYENNKTGIDV
jgi:hypothetical protein